MIICIFVFFCFVWIVKTTVYFEPFELTVFPACCILKGNKKQTSTPKNKA